jgi:phosphoribosylformimino-5-aminoimidazole carboxamide ribotide isomerase
MDVGVVDPAATRELRRTVLRPDHAPGDALPGDGLADGVHIGVRDDGGTVLATCFVFPDPCPWLHAQDAWHLRQMATAPSRRGQGIGALVLDGAVDYVRAQGGPLIWCHARETAVGFYARHGFTGFGDIFIDPEHPIPRLRMWRELSPSLGSSVQ